MSIITISLPTSISKQIDQEVSSRDLSSRADFVKNLLQRYFSKKLVFEVYDRPSLSAVRKNLTESKKYNKKFVESVVSGLSQSSMYDNRKTSSI